MFCVLPIMSSNSVCFMQSLRAWAGARAPVFVCERELLISLYLYTYELWTVDFFSALGLVTVKRMRFDYWVEFRLFCNRAKMVGHAVSLVRALVRFATNRTPNRHLHIYKPNRWAKTKLRITLIPTAAYICPYFVLLGSHAIPCRFAHTISIDANPNVLSSRERPESSR